MSAEQILLEIEKLPDNDRFQLAVELGKGIGDLRWLLCTHPDQEMVERSCLHFLGDAAQEWWAKREVSKNCPHKVCQCGVQSNGDIVYCNPKAAQAHVKALVAASKKKREKGHLHSL